MFNSLSDEKRDLLRKGITPLAKDYWESVIPYKEYTKLQEPYIEPEILLLPQAPIVNLRRE